MDHAMIHVFDSLEELSRAAADVVAAVGSGLNRDSASGSSDRSVISVTSVLSTPATIALAGGGTPRRLYQILATDYRDRINWDNTIFFFGDERYVPHDSPHSNYRMAREALLDHVPVPDGNVFPMITTFPSPDHAAADYEKTLRAHFTDDLPCFDLVLLGVGEDGHTASLFPNSAALDEKEKWVAVTEAPTEPRTRLTLTPQVLMNAKQMLFLVSGESNREVMEEIIEMPDEAVKKYPAAMIGGGGNAMWFVDRESLTPALSQVCV
jgi:6-phosphogluconolactonase